MKIIIFGNGLIGRQVATRLQTPDTTSQPSAETTASTPPPGEA